MIPQGYYALKSKLNLKFRQNILLNLYWKYKKAYKGKNTYIVPIDYHYQIIPVGSDALNLLQEIREESNQKSCLTYDERMSHIRMNMINRNAPKEQFDELIKIERLYSKIINYDDNDKKRKV